MEGEDATGSAEGTPVKKEESKDTIPSTYWRLSGVSKTALQDQVLPSAEPRTLSAANLRAAFDRLSTEEAKTEMLKVLEAATRLPKDFTLSGDLRKWSTSQDLVRTRALCRGWRALAWQLPVDWSTAGIYSIAAASYPDQVLPFVHKFTSEKTQVPFRKLPPFKDAQSDLFISSNWSERSAAISST